MQDTPTTAGRPPLWRSLRPIALVLFVLAFLGGAGWLAQRFLLAQTPHPAGSTDWTLVFEDEFDAAELDGSRWTSCYWWDKGGCTNLGNNELQWYRRGNVVPGNGTVTLEAREEPVDTSEGPFPYTSGLIATGRTDAEGEREDRFSFTYGYVEVRARLPKGQGLWPAIWLLPSDHLSRPEIDIMEMLGHAPDMLEMHYHYQKDGQNDSLGQDRQVADLSADWHDYAVDWSPEAIIWYLDGREMWRIDEPNIISDEAMYLIINLAVGGDWPGEPDAETEFPARFEVDHVRIWQRPGS
jgi:beta-glucanase (GH16 family)